jgi:hypothetical protein
VRIESDSIDVGQRSNPRSETTETVADCDECTLAFTDTCDGTDGLVDFEIADGLRIN